jgi:hypothetical protein
MISISVNPVRLLRPSRTIASSSQLSELVT